MTFPAHRAFYPAAALYGAIALPLSVLGWMGGGHAHEMLFGFALAVVAGNQLGPVGGTRIACLLALWAAARAAFLGAPMSAASGALNAAFAGALALHVAPRLFGSAKRLRNQALPAVLVAICAAAIVWQIERYTRAGVPRALVLATVMAFALLMLFMGGRIIAPAVAGQMQRQGERLEARVQPRLEGALLACGTLALAGLVTPISYPLAPVAMVLTGVLAAARLARWRLWRVRARADLLCLASGYAWLAAGLLALGGAIAAGRYEVAAVHFITVGALGTLTFNVMAMAWLLKARRWPPASPAIVWGTLLVAAAVVARIVGAFFPEPWLLVAAGCWSAAFVVLLLLFMLKR